MKHQGIFIILFVIPSLINVGCKVPMEQTTAPELSNVESPENSVPQSSDDCENSEEGNVNSPQTILPQKSETEVFGEGSAITCVRGQFYLFLTVLLPEVPPGSGFSHSEIEIHRFENQSWNYTQSLAFPGSGGSGEFEPEMSASGEWLMVRARYQGEIRVLAYQLVADQWKFHSAPEGDGTPRYGEAIEVRGNTLVVGGRRPNDGGIDVFKLQSNVWSKTHTLNPPPNPSSSTRFGNGVAIEGNTVAVSAPYAQVNGAFGMGEVYLYELLDPGNAQLKQTLRPLDTDIVETPYLGEYISMDNGLLVASSMIRVYTYRKNAQGTYERLEALRLGGDNFSELMTRNSQLLLGNHRAFNNGIAYVGQGMLFEFVANTWESIADFEPNEVFIRQYYSSGIALGPMGKHGVLTIPDNTKSEGKPIYVHAF